MRDSEKQIINYGYIGVGGAERLYLRNRWDYSLSARNTIQRPLQNHLVCFGNVNKGGIGQFGNVYAETGIAPTIAAGTHGYCVGHILVKENETNSIRIYGKRNRKTSK